MSIPQETLDWNIYREPFRPELWSFLSSAVVALALLILAVDLAYERLKSPSKTSEKQAKLGKRKMSQWSAREAWGGGGASPILAGVSRGRRWPRKICHVIPDFLFNIHAFEFLKSLKTAAFSKLFSGEVGQMAQKSNFLSLYYA